MPRSFIVNFEYYTAGESGNDRYRYANLDDAYAKFEELCHAIAVEFPDSDHDLECISETDFFARRDTRTGDYAKVVIIEKGR